MFLVWFWYFILQIFYILTKGHKEIIIVNKLNHLKILKISFNLYIYIFEWDQFIYDKDIPHIWEIDYKDLAINLCSSCLEYLQVRVHFGLYLIHFLTIKLNLSTLKFADCGHKCLQICKSVPSFISLTSFTSVKGFWRAN